MDTEKNKTSKLGVLLAVVSAIFAVSLLLAGKKVPLTGGSVSPVLTQRARCVTNNCHGAIGKGKFVHGPVAAGHCAFCHKPAGKHKFKPIPEDVSRLCYLCHETTELRAYHLPFKISRCTVCHNPHASPNRYQLRDSCRDILPSSFKIHQKNISREDPINHGGAMPILNEEPRSRDRGELQVKRKFMCSEGNREERLEGGKDFSLLARAPELTFAPARPAISI